MTLRTLAYVLLTFLAIGCQEPLRTSCFRSVEGWGGWKEGDTLSMSIDLRHTEGPRRLYLCARAREEALKSDFEIRLTFISPSGSTYRDTVKLRIEETEGGRLEKKGNTLQVLWPYMEIDSLNREGLWKILVERGEKDLPAYSDILGLGISAE